MHPATLSTPESVNAAWQYLSARNAVARPVSLLMGCPKHAAALRQQRDQEDRGRAFGLRVGVPLIVRITP